MTIDPAAIEAAKFHKTDENAAGILARALLDAEKVVNSQSFAIEKLITGEAEQHDRADALTAEVERLKAAYRQAASRAETAGAEVKRECARADNAESRYVRAERARVEAEAQRDVLAKALKWAIGDGYIESLERHVLLEHHGDVDFQNCEKCENPARTALAGLEVKR